MKLQDLRIIATLGVGGFGRVELVQIAGDSKQKSFALKQMKKSQVSYFYGHSRLLEIDVTRL